MKRRLHDRQSATSRFAPRRRVGSSLRPIGDGVVRRFSLSFGVGLLAVSIAGVAAAAPYSRFGLCVAPTPPVCIHASLKKKNDRDECTRITNGYISLVFAYRACLSVEMERAVREANETITTLGCATGRQDCRRARDDEKSVGASAPSRRGGE
jgi:hypothetical protein